jgi:hypothetical protein
MASYSITTAQNITALTGKAGGDTYSINGGTLIIDSDTRYGPNTSVSTGPFGGIGGSATLGGNITITGGNVRLIPYSLGAGVVPASGTTISRNGVSAELLCVMANRTGGTVTAAGGVMPVSGWLKVRNITGGAFSAGLMTGITATASGPDETGWIEVVGVETLALTINRLNICTMNGEWFSVGTTNGTRGQTMQLPAFDAITEYPGVEIETAPGSGVYKFWANAGQKATSANLGTDSRSRMVWVSSPAVLKIGQGVDGSTCMDLPVSGCNVRVPNIIFSSCTAANKAINATPNTTIGSRYEIATNASGNISITRVTQSRSTICTPVSSRSSLSAPLLRKSTAGTLDSQTTQRPTHQIPLWCSNATAEDRLPTFPACVPRACRPLVTQYILSTYTAASRSPTSVAHLHRMSLLSAGRFSSTLAKISPAQILS